MDFLEPGRPTTAIYIRIKRFNDTFFLLCDEYETIESLKNRLLVVMQKMGLQLPKQEEPFIVDDVRLYLKNRVSNRNECDETLLIDSGQQRYPTRLIGVQWHWDLPMLKETLN